MAPLTVLMRGEVLEPLWGQTTVWGSQDPGVIPAFVT